MSSLVRVTPDCETSATSGAPLGLRDPMTSSRAILGELTTLRDEYSICLVYLYCEIIM